MNLAAITVAMCIRFVIGALVTRRSESENDARFWQGIKDLGAAIAQG